MYAVNSVYMPRYTLFAEYLGMYTRKITQKLRAYMPRYTANIVTVQRHHTSFLLLNNTVVWHVQRRRSFVPK